MTDENEGAASLTVAHNTTAEGVGEVFKATREFITEHTRSAVIELVEPNTGLKTLALLDPDGGMSCLPDRVFDDVRVGPRFRRGTAAMTALDSFVAHIVRFGDADTAVFADDRREAPKLTAVLDYNRGDTAGQHGDYRHGRHRTTFAFPLSDEWRAWVKGNGVKMAMADFALFLEDRIGDIALRGDEYPEDIARFVNVNGGAEAVADYATLIELSRGLKVYEAAQVEEATNLASGEGHIRFSVEHETRDRKGGSVKVPTMFFIAIPIFKQGPFYRIAVRLRYRKTPAGIVFWFDLYQQDRSFDHAFAEAVERVRVDTPAQVFFGAPEA